MSATTFKQSIELGFRRWKDYEGRSGRAEYWWFALFYLLVAVVPSLFVGDAAPSLVLALVVLAVSLITSVVMLSLTVRRLHDTGRSGWWILLSAIPIIGTIVLFIWYAQKGDPGDNKYGTPSDGPIVKIEVL